MSSAMGSPLILTTGQKREWVTPLIMGCCKYKDPDTQEYLTYPLFCPIAMLCTGILAGRIVTQLYNETPLCFEMGCRGLCCCCASVPIHLGSPLGGMSMFVCVSYLLRERVIEKYYVNEPESCCCGPCNPCCEILHINCNYPCSLFQMYVSVREWERERRNILASTAPSSATNPTAPSMVITPVKSQPTGTPIAVPRESVPAQMQYNSNNGPMFTPVHAVVAGPSNGVQVAIPVATPIVFVNN